jgi:hypothetical protein
MSGADSPTGVDLIQLYVSLRLVPQCAMRVTRSVEGGPMRPLAPTTSCSCYFDYLATGATSCKVCGASTECPATAPNCNRFGSQSQGYCEP